MKTLVILLVVLVTTSIVSAQPDIVQGIRVSGRVDNTTSGAVGCQSGDLGFKCDTCTSFLVCNGANQLGNSSCPSPYGFCDSITNQCTSEIPAECSDSPSGFDCRAEGFFPDPDDCTVYVFCNATLQVEVYRCPEGYVYDALNGYCKRKIFHWDCVTMECTRANSFIVHKTNPNYYAYCDNSLDPIMFKCPNNMQFDSGCRYVCKKVGYHIGQNKSEAYFCARSGFSWKVSVYKCPRGYEYNASFTCVKSV